MEKIEIGKIVNAVGLKGEVKVYNYSEGAGVYEDNDTVYVGDRPAAVERVRMQKNMVVLKLAGVDDRTAAEQLKGTVIYIDGSQLPELPEGQYYIRDLIGMDARDQDGSALGRISDVLQNTAQSILEIEREDGHRILIPYVSEFILDVDTENRHVDIRIIDGMLDL